MDYERIDLLVQEIEEHLPTSIQIKLGELVGMIVSEENKQKEPVVGLIIKEIKRNANGQIIFSGFCANIKGEAENFIINTWENNWGLKYEWTKTE